MLVADLDPQGNASTGMGIRHDAREVTVYDVVVSEADIKLAIVPTPVDRLHAVPATIDLAGAEIELVSQFSRESRLKKALEPVGEGVYDFILLDCPPSLGLLTINALTAAEELIVPIQCEYYALEGLGQLLRNVSLVQQNINSGLRLSGIVMTMFDPRTKLSEQVVQEVQRYFGDLVYGVIIPRTVRLSEAPGFGQPITVYDPKSKGAEAYRQLAREVALRPPPDAPMPLFEDMPIAVMTPVDEVVTVDEVDSAPKPERAEGAGEAATVSASGACEPTSRARSSSRASRIERPGAPRRRRGRPARGHRGVPSGRSGAFRPAGGQHWSFGRGSLGGASTRAGATGQAALEPCPSRGAATPEGRRDRREPATSTSMPRARSRLLRRGRRTSSRKGWPTSGRRSMTSRAGSGAGACSGREASDVQTRRSGTGLSALIPGAPEAGETSTGLLEVPANAIAPNPKQPRSRFDDETLAELAASIREVGILQPIVVRRTGQGYEVVTGERRLRAAKLAGLATVPVVLRDSDDSNLLREALIENIHREDLNPIELGEAFRQLLDELGLKQEELADRVGVSRSHIANTIRLLALPFEVQQLLTDEKISAGHARALLALGDADAITSLSLRVAAEDLSVRETEEIVRRFIEAPAEPSPKKEAEVPRAHRPESRRGRGDLVGAARDPRRDPDGAEAGSGRDRFRTPPTTSRGSSPRSSAPVPASRPTE